MERAKKLTAKKAAGNLGEDAAAEFLRARGYRILARQWRCRFGELDLVAEDAEGIVCFVEVKLRKRNALELPREAVTPAKQKRLRLAAQCYLIAAGLEESRARFDVAEVYTDGDGRILQIGYLEDAFE